jgi:peptidoglycan-associated lipoprotein
MSRVFCTLAVAVMAVGGCAHKQETKAEAPKAEPAPAPVASTAPAPSSDAKTCASDLDCGAKQLCLNNKCVDITPDLAACTDVRVHFPFNSDEIDSADKPQLDRSARCLKADHALHITIEGNADERGTEEYNMALGDRRARSVAGYLASLGASQTQVATVSFGKENPECQEHDEACWARNRRAALKAGNSSKSKK